MGPYLNGGMAPVDAPSADAAAERGVAVIERQRRFVGTKEPQRITRQQQPRGIDHQRCVVALINHGEEVRGGSALHYATRKRQREVIKQLGELEGISIRSLTVRDIEEQCVVHADVIGEVGDDLETKLAPLADLDGVVDLEVT